MGLPGGPVLESRWSGIAWETTLDGQILSGSPWEALETVVRSREMPWVGAATFEMACAEAGLPHRPPAAGDLGQRWTGIRTALHRRGDGALEGWSWDPVPPPPGTWLRPPLRTGSAEQAVALSPRWDEARHRVAVESIRARILEGRFYVANLCVPFEGRFHGQPANLAEVAFRRARPPFGALLDLGDLTLLCLSMERLLARRGEALWSEPIKGTTPLTGDGAGDLAAAARLASDPKERAEHTMIVDLIRNDLGRVARPGSVSVPRLMAVEPFPTVQQMVSTVEATARPGLGLADLLRSVLPGGSVTGAPKHAVCAHLADAEAGPRGFYCGALGWIAPDGDLDLALPIRTAQIRGDRVTYWTGGGITHRSDPAREWAELLLKTRALTG
ncbi:MAG TPA: chorismate-binding protein [Holophagaceae bacterium]